MLPTERERDMKLRSVFVQILAWLMVVLLTVPPGVIAQQQQSEAVFRQEEFDQILAPIALHTDPLISQISMASTYPLAVIQADRCAKQHASLKYYAQPK